MGLYNYDPFFAPGVRSGAILQTIRRKRLNPDKPGNFLHHYIGMRTRSVELLCRTKCTSVQDIVIVLLPGPGPCVEIIIDSVALSPDEKIAFAIADGFPSYTAWLNHWLERILRKPFVGDLIRWQEPKGPHICEGLRKCRHCGGPA